MHACIHACHACIHTCKNTDIVLHNHANMIVKQIIWIILVIYKYMNCMVCIDLIIYVCACLHLHFSYAHTHAYITADMMRALLFWLCVWPLTVAWGKTWIWEPDPDGYRMFTCFCKAREILFHWFTTRRVSLAFLQSKIQFRRHFNFERNPGVVDLNDGLQKKEMRGNLKIFENLLFGIASVGEEQKGESSYHYRTAMVPPSQVSKTCAGFAPRAQETTLWRLDTTWMVWNAGCVPLCFSVKPFVMGFSWYFVISGHEGHAKLQHVEGAWSEQNQSDLAHHGRGTRDHGAVQELTYDHFSLYSVSFQFSPAMQVERFIRAMYFPPFDGAAMLVNGRQMPVESLEADVHAVQAQIKPMLFWRFHKKTVGKLS